MDKKIRSSERYWERFKYDHNKSIQSNAGFSEREDVNEALNVIKNKLRSTINKHLNKNSDILDLGCGPGIYLNEIEKAHKTYGIDISEEMIEAAKKKLSNTVLYKGGLDQLEESLKFDMIYSISVLEYIPPTQLESFFKNLLNKLKENGILFIQYPHAISYKDIWYPNRYYVKYSPKKINKIVARVGFEILEHEQSFNGKKIEKYDSSPYGKKSRTFKDGYLLIARKN